jgi:Flp pilus assembly protein TadD
VLALAPEHADATNNLGASLLALGDQAAAIELFERAVTLAPEDPDAHRILATVLCRAGDVGRAVAVLEKALATLSPPPAELADRLAWMRAPGASPRCGPPGAGGTPSR